MRLHSITVLATTAVLWTLSAETRADTTEITIEATIDRGGDFVGFGFGSLWMMSGRNLIQIEASDNSVTDTPIEGVAGSFRGIAIGEGAVWIPNVGSMTIFKFDPDAKRVTLKIAADLWGSEGSIGIGEGSVWAVVGAESKVLARYDAETGAETATIELPSESSGVVVDFGSVWVAGTGKGELYRIDPETNKIVAIIPVKSQPRFLSSGEGSVWVLSQGEGTVERIDGRNGGLLATIAAGAKGEGGDITVGGGYVWVTTMLVPIIKIDPQTNALAGQFRRPRGVYLGDAIRFGDGSLWISGSSVSRIVPPE